MKPSTALTSAAAFVTNAALAAGATTSFCPNNDNVCISWGVPQSTASSSNGDIYFQMKGPSTNSWVGLGIGSQMKGAYIFIMYADGNGNVTLSTRQGTGEVQPQYVQRSNVELLAGSGVSNGEMIANVRCTSCDGLDLTGSSTNWITAWKEGDAIDSTDPSANLVEHTVHTAYTVDLSQASITSDSNPFVGSSSSTPPSSGGSGSSGSSGSSGGSGGSGSAVSVDSGNNNNMLQNAHGIIMTVVFVLGYPVGSMLMPLLGKWYLHASWNMIIFLGMWAGFGVGYVLAHREGIFFDQAHTRLGTILCALFSLQPILGWLHHMHFRKHQKRGVMSFFHVWYGRLLMILGIINGGCGLMLASGPRSWIIVYSVFSVVFFLLYVAASTFGWFRGRKRNNMSKETSNGMQNDAYQS